MMSQASPKTNKIFVGGISRDTTDGGFASYFSRFGEIKECMIMRDKATQASRGFGFVTFADSTSVDKVLATECDIDGRIVDCKLSVPQDSGARTEESHRTRKIFVGGLAPATTQDELKDHFSAFGTVINAVIKMDTVTGRSRGFGFVTFDTEDAVLAVCSRTHSIGSKPVEVKKSMPRGMVDVKAPANFGGYGGYPGFGAPRPYGGGFGGYGAPEPRLGVGDTGRPKVFVGGLAQETTEADLSNHFSQFGDVVSAQIMMDSASNRSRGFGFVIFGSEDAVSNVLARHHTIMGKMVECKRARPRAAQGAPAAAPMRPPYGRGYDPNPGYGGGGFGAPAYGGMYGGYGAQPHAPSKMDRSFHPYR